jgi:hypothetical protein
MVKEHNREIQWTKILMILKQLKSNLYDYIVWIDADTIILNPEKTIEKFIDRLMKGKDIMYSKDFGGWVNNGVIFIKNSKRSIEFFEETWKHTNEICREQGAMDMLWRHNWNNCKDWVEITEDTTEYNPMWFEYKHGIFLMHFPGSGEPNRLPDSLRRMMDMFTPLKLEGDNGHALDTDESLQERLRWLREDAEVDLRHKKHLCNQQGWKYFPIELE